ncbi:anti-sigma factor family protein [Enterococcus lemanii]|uniref:Anti-sigma-W factor RsiW n=1 Tax=Enterococcus lemanii TaxID=1159752 RepID=A0ABV9MV02_9ENTE|nr:zf-HC2 domain-containing protein [Enterococcus lemanii]MBM7710186.1 hypothetical protein [Enterococcus lemanii]
MKEISCNVIQDLLPLYVDDVVSKETEALVEEHLTHCPKCQKEVAQMKRNLSFPIEKKAPLMQGLSKKWRSKNRMIAGISVLLTSLILFGTFYFIFYFDRLIPYSDSLIKIEKQENGYLSAHYYGDNYFSISATEPMSVIVDGQEKKAVFLHYTKTFATAHAKQFFQNEGSRDEKDFIFSLDDEQEIDVVYYADFDAIKIFNQGNKWEPVLEHAELIWEK